MWTVGEDGKVVKGWSVGEDVDCRLVGEVGMVEKIVGCWRRWKGCGVLRRMGWGGVLVQEI